MAWRYAPVSPATVAEKANSPMRRRRESRSSRIILTVVDYFARKFVAFMQVGGRRLACLLFGV